MKKIYESIMAILAIASIVLVCLDLTSIISIVETPYVYIDLCILIIFTIDYLTRLILSDNKCRFFKSNIFDLLAIIPFNYLFAAFRIFRIFRFIKISKLTKLSRVVRAASFANIIKNRISDLLHTNGLIYYIYINALTLLTSSIVMSYVEHMSFLDALWWSIVTCTTVGYGDISPTTNIGRCFAVILMLFGIGLIGMLTSAITTYFTQSQDKNNTFEKELIEKFNELDFSDKLEVMNLIDELAKK